MRIEIPEKKKWVFETVIPIRWGDMDAMGHLNNTSYFRFMETARIDWFTQLGCSPLPTGEGPVIINAFCNFYKQLEYPGEVLLKMYTGDAGAAVLSHGPLWREPTCRASSMRPVAPPRCGWISRHKSQNRCRIGCERSWIDLSSKQSLNHFKHML